MRKYIIKAKSILLLGFILLISCTDSFEDINTDPDKLPDVAQTNLLAGVIFNTSYRMFDTWFMMDEPMTFAGYTAKLQYTDENRYQYRTGVQDTNWEYLYAIYGNIKTIQARSEGLNNMLNVSKVMEAHTILIATDRWRDVPYTEAGLLVDGKLQPSYDTQEEIYPALLSKLKEAADGFVEGGTDDLGDGDLLFHGDVDKWQKFCNSLRLRIAMRISGVSTELSKSVVEEVLTNPTKYPIMESNDDNAFFYWIGSDPNYYEPVANSYRTRPNDHGGSDVIINHMNAKNDPRRAAFFMPTGASAGTATPVFNGFVIGSLAWAAPISDYSKLSVKYGQDLGGFSPYMRVAEVYFIIAEAASKGWNTGGLSAKDAYETALSLSFEENEVSSADATAYINGAGKFDGTLKQIWYEQWVAMFKQGMEGWSHTRRTGIPDNLYIAPGRAPQYADHNIPPFRSPYPATERNLNSANCKPFDDQVVDNLWGKQMWWDTRTGVH